MNAAQPQLPAFVRRHAATSIANDPNALVGLVCDENFWVRREAARNPNAPEWVIDLLVRAGAAPDLRGFNGEVDESMTPEELRRLVECGPWARQLVAEHPNTAVEVLAILASVPTPRVRSAVAAHAHTAPETLGHLCADIEPEVRAFAARHPATSSDTISLLIDAGASPDLMTVSSEPVRCDPHGLSDVAALGPFAKFLAARHPECPTVILEQVAVHEDWRIRSALFDNPSTPPALAERVLGEHTTDKIKSLATRHPEQLAALADHPLPEIRLAVARHLSADRGTLAKLAADGIDEIRRLVAADPRTDPSDINLLVRAGSTRDLTCLSEPDLTLDPAMLDSLARGGSWARQLAVRHPSTSAASLGRLLCDDEPRLREWAAAHPSAPESIITLIQRAGGADDWQGIGENDPSMTVEELQQVASLGPWGAWVVSWHPNSPASRAIRNDNA